MPWILFCVINGSKSRLQDHVSTASRKSFIVYPVAKGISVMNMALFSYSRKNTLVPYREEMNRKFIGKTIFEVDKIKILVYYCKALNHAGVVERQTRCLQAAVRAIA